MTAVDAQNPFTRSIPPASWERPEPDAEKIARLERERDAARAVAASWAEGTRERLKNEARIRREVKRELDAEEQGPAREFRAYTVADLAAIPAPDPLVRGLLFRASKARVFGPSNVGKTFVVLDLAAHVACGIPWQGRETAQARVLYVAAEGAPSIGGRLRVWEAAHGRPCGVLTWPEAVQIGGPHWPAFVEWCAAQRFGLVVVDTQAAATEGLDENSNTDAAVVQRALTRLVEATGACVLLVHHTGHEETDRARGASAAFGGLDTELRLDGRDGLLALTSCKQRYAERANKVRLRLVRYGEGLVVSTTSEAEAFLMGGTDHEKVHANVAALQAANADPGKSLRSLIVVLRDDLNHKGASDLLRRSVHEFKRQAGIPVGADEG